MESDLTTVVKNTEEKQKAESAVQIFADFLVLLIEKEDKTNRDINSIKELLGNEKNKNGTITNQ